MKKLRVELVLAAVVLVLAGSCSGGNDPDESGDRTPPTVDRPTSSDATGSSESALDASEDRSEPSTIAELEVAWAEVRTAVVASLRDGDFGVGDDGVLVGPGGLSVDLNSCPSDWTDRAGSGRIEITQIASSGDFPGLGDGMAAYFEHVNDSGGINGRSIEFRAIDDERIPTKTIEAVDDLLGGRAPLAITTFGTTSSQAVFDQLNRACIPQPFVGSAHPAWGDPANHPWTSGLQMAYSTEAIVWGNWIGRNLAPELPVTVSALVVDNDFGRAYHAAFAQWAASNRDVVAEFVPVWHEPGASSIDEAIASIVESRPQVFLALTAGTGCEMAVAAGEPSGLNEMTSARFIPSVCSNPTRFFQPSDRSGDGYLMVDGGFRATNDPLYVDDPFVAFINGLLAEAGVDPESGLAGVGAGQYAWAHVEALRIANELDGGVTRSNVLLAMRSLQLRHPLLIPGVSFASSGVSDAYYVEGSRVSRYSAGLGAWEPESLVVDLDGATPSCAWDGQQC